MNTRTLFLLLAGLLCGLAAAQAQKRNYIIYHNAETGRDTIVRGVSFLKETPERLQHAVTVITSAGGQTYTPDELLGFRGAGKARVSKPLLIDGTVRRLFVERAGDIGDAFVAYRYINPLGIVEYYYHPTVAIDAPEPTLLPMKGEGDNAFAAPLMALLEQSPAMRREEVAQAVSRSEATYKRYMMLAHVCRTDNPNYLPTGFRWGPLVGIGSGTLHMRDYTFDRQTPQGMFGLFGDLPIVNGVSLHPELTFHKYAFNGPKGGSNSEEEIIHALKMGIGSEAMAYNRQDITPTLLIRYTLLPLRSKVLPFVQAGVGANIVLSGNMQTQQYLMNISANHIWLERQTHPITKPLGTLTVGVGVEMKVLRRHSLFLDLRYRRELTRQPLSGVYTTLSFNL
ncbi:MAG: PorT family protein [Prevotellaceae bacterium]|jgi:hypothetical protein|nr:PorT family protein [Prevotellaceae bacterium]